MSKTGCRTWDRLAKPRRCVCLLSNAVCLTLLAVALPLALAQDQAAGHFSVPKPTQQIELSHVGYQGLSRIARLNQGANLSLDFVDTGHVLLTFNQKKLFKRLANCQRNHDDKVVRAVVLEIPSGKISAEAVWYLHDHGRYLWSLGSGKFLLRKANSLYSLDANLHEELLMNSSKALTWVAVTPDKRQILVETDQNSNSADSFDPSNEQGKVKGDFRLEFLDATTLSVERTIELKTALNLEGSSAGYADCLRKGRLWMIRFGPSADERRNITRIRSQGFPQIFYPSDDALLVGRNPLFDKNYYSVTAYTVTGQRLWREHWDERRYFVRVLTTANRQRFAISSLISQPHSPDPADYDNLAGLDDYVEPDGFSQRVEVFETGGGRRIFSLPVGPAVASGHNVALSPNGERLAVIQGEVLRLYDLPDTSAIDPKQLIALDPQTSNPNLQLDESQSPLQPASFTEQESDAADGIQIEPDVEQSPRASQPVTENKLPPGTMIYSTENSPTPSQAPRGKHRSARSRPLHFAVQLVPIGDKREVDRGQARKLLSGSGKKTDWPATVAVQHYGIDFAIDGSDLRFHPDSEGGHEGRLGFSIATYSRDGRKLTEKSEVWDTELSSSDYEQAVNLGVRIHQDIDVSTNAASIRFNVQDKMSNHQGLIEVLLGASTHPDPAQSASNRLPEIEPD